jgi:peptide/nickel transport system permease protein
MFRFFQQLAIIIILIIILAALPLIISIGPERDGLVWNFAQLPEIFRHFFSQILSGSLGTYQLGMQERDIAQDIGDNFLTSLKVMVISGNAAVILSIIFGVFISRYRAAKVFNFFLNVLSAIPDFILIIFSLVIAVSFYKWTGIRIVSLRPDAGALNLWFPTLLVSIAPTLYLFKIVSVKYYQTGGEDYIRTAVAKGMGINYINFQHVYKNIEPFIKAETVKMISLSAGNLFIVEYIMNVSGITKFIFQSTDVQPVIIGLFSMLVISAIVYGSIRLVLYLFKRGFIYE